ncbi:unnamed protein product, partial [Amoebophrya sp. A25]
ALTLSPDRTRASAEARTVVRLRRDAPLHRPAASRVSAFFAPHTTGFAGPVAPNPLPSWSLSRHFLSTVVQEPSRERIFSLT